MLDTLTTFLVDLDGVIYRGEEILPGAQDFVAWLEAQHKNYLFLTNNSFASDSQVIGKLGHLGITTDTAHVMGAGQAAVQNIARRFPGGSVYIVGEEPLAEMVTAHGLKIADADAHKADAVLVGLDRMFDYKKLTGAVAAIRGGAAFVAINRDPLLPIVGDIVPGCGAMVAAIEASSETKPEIIGKPEPTLLQEAMAKLGSQAQETVMIGDNIGVDIKGGIAAGTRTLLVFSGKDTPASLATSTIKPDYVYNDLAAVMDVLAGRLPAEQQPHV
ncbi:MAG TPA: HAD-IIA family hydrolase [Ktedonobacteraceae bacterium]|jgi:HAD superfamily hydrolase (TIGR01457 family)|nr:HAD-IIA family hydrolase [Ktedonobacteraceae bacterium]